MPATQDVQTCDLGLTEGLLNLGLPNFLAQHKIQNKFTVKKYFGI
jgi:hypothetical protein